MKKIQKSTLFVILALTAALLLGACGGQAAAELDANAQAETDAGGEVQAATQADAAVAAEQDASGGEDTGAYAEQGAEANAEAEAEAQAEVGVEVFPALVLGSADFHATNPAEVTLASGQIQFIEFFAYWCSTCKAMAPHVHGLEQLYGDRVNFVYLDRDDPATANFQAQLGYVYQPHIFILDGAGNILYQSVYFTEAVDLQTAIEAALANN